MAIVNDKQGEVLLSVKNLSLSLPKKSFGAEIKINKKASMALANGAAANGLEQSHAQLLHDISFQVKVGQGLALLGESGSGKTLTALTLAGLLSPYQAWHRSGEISWRGKTYSVADDRARAHLRGREIGMVFQEPQSVLNPLHTIGKQLMEALTLSGKYANLLEQKLELLQLLQAVNLYQADYYPKTLEKDFIDYVMANSLAKKFSKQMAQDKKLQQFLRRYPYQLSGGQKQRLLIAMALAGRPSLLIADEPTTALDNHLKKQILLLIKSIVVTKNLSLIYITHDLNSVEILCDEVVLLEKGRVIERGPLLHFIQRPNSDVAKKLLLFEFPVKTAWQKINREAGELKQDTVSNMHRVVAEPLLWVTDFSITIPSSKFWFNRRSAIGILQDINFELCRGKTLGVIGASGSGKTSLAYGLLRLYPEHYLKGQVQLKIHNALSNDNKNNYILKNMNGVAINWLGLNQQQLKAHRHIWQMIFQDPFSSLPPRYKILSIVAEAYVLAKLAYPPESKKNYKRKKLV